MFLGHVVSDKGISPLPDRVKAIKEFPHPTSAKPVEKLKIGDRTSPPHEQGCLGVDKLQSYPLDNKVSQFYGIGEHLHRERD